MKKNLISIGSFIGYLAVSYGLDFLTSDSATGGIQIWGSASFRFIIYTWFLLAYLLFGVITILYTWYRINSRESNLIIDVSISLIGLPVMLLIGLSGFLPFGIFYQAIIFSVLLSLISLFHLNKHTLPFSSKPTKSNVKKGLLYFALIILTSVALGFIFKDSIMIIVADVLWDNKIHNYTCEDLPSREFVEQALEDNKEFVDQIEDVKPGFIEVGAGYIKECPDKADILIEFQGHAQRETIEEMIGTELLFGIPFRMTNN